jgi:hypothetical protein
MFIRKSDNLPEEIAKIFIRDGSSVPFEISKVYVRDANGLPVLVFDNTIVTVPCVYCGSGESVYYYNVGFGSVGAPAGSVTTGNNFSRNHEYLTNGKLATASPANGCDLSNTPSTPSGRRLGGFNITTFNSSSNVPTQYSGANGNTRNSKIDRHYWKYVGYSDAKNFSQTTENARFYSAAYNTFGSGSGSDFKNWMREIKLDFLALPADQRNITTYTQSNIGIAGLYFEKLLTSLDENARRTEEFLPGTLSYPIIPGHILVTYDTLSVRDSIYGVVKKHTIVKWNDHAFSDSLGSPPTYFTAQGAYNGLLSSSLVAPKRNSNIYPFHNMDILLRNRQEFSDSGGDGGYTFDRCGQEACSSVYGFSNYYNFRNICAKHAWNGWKYRQDLFFDQALCLSPGACDPSDPDQCPDPDGCGDPDCPDGCDPSDPSVICNCDESESGNCPECPPNDSGTGGCCRRTSAGVLICCPPASSTSTTTGSFFAGGCGQDEGYCKNFYNPTWTSGEREPLYFNLLKEKHGTFFAFGTNGIYPQDCCNTYCYMPFDSQSKPQRGLGEGCHEVYKIPPINCRGQQGVEAIGAFHASTPNDYQYNDTPPATKLTFFGDMAHGILMGEGSIADITFTLPMYVELDEKLKSKIISMDSATWDNFVLTATTNWSSLTAEEKSIWRAITSLLGVDPSNSTTSYQNGGQIFADTDALNSGQRFINKTYLSSTSFYYEENRFATGQTEIQDSAQTTLSIAANTNLQIPIGIDTATQPSSLGQYPLLWWSFSGFPTEKSTHYIKLKYRFNGSQCGNVLDFYDRFFTGPNAQNNIRKIIKGLEFHPIHFIYDETELSNTNKFNTEHHVHPLFQKYIIPSEVQDLADFVTGNSNHQIFMNLNGDDITVKGNGFVDIFTGSVDGNAITADQGGNVLNPGIWAIWDSPITTTIRIQNVAIPQYIKYNHTDLGSSSGASMGYSCLVVPPLGSYAEFLSKYYASTSTI